MSVVLIDKASEAGDPRFARVPQPHDHRDPTAWLSSHRKKSLQACKWSISALKGDSPGARRKRLYLWTFTFPDVLSIADASVAWTDLARDLVRRLGFYGGRVFELHTNHGLHIHLVTNKRFPVKKVREYTTAHGFGRIDVTPLTKDPYYAAKYLAKAHRAPCLSGKRLWQCIGDFDGCKVKDVLLRSPISDILEAIKLSQNNITKAHFANTPQQRQFILYLQATEIWFENLFNS